MTILFTYGPKIVSHDTWLNYTYCIHVYTKINSQGTEFPTRLHVRPVKTQISLLYPRSLMRIFTWHSDQTSSYAFESESSQVAHAAVPRLKCVWYGALPVWTLVVREARLSISCTYHLFFAASMHWKKKRKFDEKSTKDRRSSSR